MSIVSPPAPANRSFTRNLYRTIGDAASCGASAAPASVVTIPAGVFTISIATTVPANTTSSACNPGQVPGGNFEQVHPKEGTAPSVTSTSRGSQNRRIIYSILPSAPRKNRASAPESNSPVLLPLFRVPHSFLSKRVRGKTPNLDASFTRAHSLRPHNPSHLPKPQ